MTIKILIICKTIDYKYNNNNNNKGIDRVCGI